MLSHRIHAVAALVRRCRVRERRWRRDRWFVRGQRCDRSTSGGGQEDATTATPEEHIPATETTPDSTTGVHEDIHAKLLPSDDGACYRPGIAHRCIPLLWPASIGRGRDIHVGIEQLHAATVAGVHLRPGKEHTEEAGGRVIRTPDGDHPHVRVLPPVHPAVRNMAQRSLRVAWVARTDRKGLLAAVGREAVRHVQRVAVLDFCSELGPLPATAISSSFKADRCAEEATNVNLRYKSHTEYPGKCSFVWLFCT